MIKIETSYNNDNDNFTWNYQSDNSHTMEHLAVIQNLFDLIVKNDKNFNTYEKIFEEIKTLKSNVEQLQSYESEKEVSVNE